MVKQIVRDVFFLGQPSEPATKADIQVGKDLQEKHIRPSCKSVEQRFGNHVSTTYL